jgi:hypothetical protein
MSQQRTVIPNERLAHKEHEIWVVFVDKHRERVHERLVVVHTARGVHKHHIDAIAGRLLNGQSSDICGIFVVATVKKGYSKAVAMCLELFNCPRSTSQTMAAALTGTGTQQSCLNHDRDHI